MTTVTIPVEVLAPPSGIMLQCDIAQANPGQSVQLLVRDVDTDSVIPAAALSVVRGAGSVYPPITGNDGAATLNITGAPGRYTILAAVGALTATVTIQVVEPGLLPDQTVQAFKVGDVSAMSSVQPEIFRTFDEFVEAMAAAIQVRARSSNLVDMSEGSVLLSFVEAVAGAVGLFGQAQVAELLAKSRAATSSGADLDSWLADFGVQRQPAVPASGIVTFRRATTTAAAIVPVGAHVGNAQNSSLFAVIEDAGHPEFNGVSYVMRIGVDQLDVPVRCTSAGASGNAMAGAINTLGSALAGVDGVFNAAAFTNGRDLSSDEAMREFFRLFLAALGRANIDAIEHAIESAYPSAVFVLVEGRSYESDAEQPGYFFVVADDGTGAPPQTFLTGVRSAIDAVRPIGLPSFGVFAPVQLTAGVAMSVTVSSGADESAVRALVRTAVANYLSGLGIGVSLPFTRLAAVAYSASDLVTSVSGVLLNGGTSDLVATVRQVIRPGTVSVS